MGISRFKAGDIKRFDLGANLKGGAVNKFLLNLLVKGKIRIEPCSKPYFVR